ncbi:hypothetical protein QE443_002139 [Pantoea ananatis]|jgi:hypothetical protein|nr:hypothetical protein [Pantoea ananatis]MDR6089272.1 hypothetical protein [Pantoea ananatis]PVY86844.1 hypothetical protein C7427_102305 [Pantoea ananatis]CRH29473.1 hypothetical protein BN1182_BH_00060 [Pantoea ananatis]CRH33947.1 hypothetical protein BN1183_AY_00950 [Pantoea ananatis]
MARNVRKVKVSPRKVNSDQQKATENVILVTFPFQEHNDENRRIQY